MPMPWTSSSPPPLPKVAHLEAYIEELSIADLVDDAALDLAYEELEEMDPATFETKASSILQSQVLPTDDEEAHKRHEWWTAHARRTHASPGVV
jgi:hypothetical protein